MRFICTKINYYGSDSALSNGDSTKVNTLDRLTRKDTILFLLFVASGFCGLLYQVIWLRLAFAAFGIITPVLSVVVSVFMLGLAFRSWAGGKWIGPLTAKAKKSAIWLYAALEFCIGIGAFMVPSTFALGETWLLQAGAMDSTRYLLLSALILSMSLLPWCIFMGATFPFMMSYIKENDRQQRKSFSYLYLANVIGAACGTVLTSFVLIEVLGFSRCLMVAGCTNFLVAATAAMLGTRSHYFRVFEPPISEPNITDNSPSEPLLRPHLLMLILFVTGFSSMAMEIVWTRAFTPILRTTIYSFAGLLTTYLLATWIGSLAYREHLAKGRVQPVFRILSFLAISSFLPILLNDPRLITAFSPEKTNIPIELFMDAIRAVAALASIFPFCAALGYLTPRLIDEYSEGAPQPAGKAYAINIIGSILGPLFAGYILLPNVGTRYSLVLLAVPFLIFYLYFWRPRGTRTHVGVATICITMVLLVVSLFCVISYEDGMYYKSAEVRRDYVATVISCGQGMKKRLLINGVGITGLTPITKAMAHVPMGMFEEKPDSVLVLCFGMGTTFRSLVSWDVKTTAVELVPSVQDAFGFYFDDAEAVLKPSNARIIIDDARRFLKRTSERFDVITIDPPPPICAAGSNLLYSEEFYEVLKNRLKEGGILQQWSPGGERLTQQAMFKAICATFPFVRAFHSIEGFGFHFFASMQPLNMPSVEVFLAHLPPAAAADFVEWSQGKSAGDIYHELLLGEIPVSDFLSPHMNDSITDDRPFNEYFLLRKLWNKVRGRDQQLF